MRSVRAGDGGVVLIRTPFEQFYESTFKPALDHVTSGPVFNNGHTIDQASWDRKAAYLLFLVMNGQSLPTEPPVTPPQQSVEEMFG
jgi:hypothetical protein